MHNSEAYALCSQCMNRKVRIGTVYGHELEGYIVNLDHENVYLQMPSRELFRDAYIHSNAYGNGREEDRPFYGGSSSQDVILTLSLFLLLTIVLL